MSTRENLRDVVTETDGNWVDKLTGAEPFFEMNFVSVISWQPKLSV